MDAGLTDPVGSLPRGARAPVRAYLAELSAGLPRRGSVRAEITDEVCSGLLDDIDARMAAGLSPTEAARAGVREFGDPRVLAAQFSAALSRATARRVGLALLGTGPLVGFLWVTALAGPAGRAWWDQVASLPATLPLTLPRMLPDVLPILGVTAPSAVVALLAGSRHAPRVPVGPRAAVTAALIATLGCVLADGLLLTRMLSAPVPGWSVAAAIACIGSSVRLIAAGTAAWRCVGLRAAVP